MAQNRDQEEAVDTTQNNADDKSQDTPYVFKRFFSCIKYSGIYLNQKDVLQMTI